jgi:hypothetical protein
MIKIMKLFGLLGFIICLLIMYTTNHGIRDIQRFDRSFRLLDMRFHYNHETVRQTFEQIGEGGRKAYQRFLLLDFIFIICFFIVMLTITDAVFVDSYYRGIIYILCILRALFDISENLLLLHMLAKYPVFNEALASICSWFTTLKFIVLYIWLLLTAVHAIIQAVRLIDFRLQK